MISEPLSAGAAHVTETAVGEAPRAEGVVTALGMPDNVETEVIDDQGPNP
jgi:hypothetical protein